MSWANRYIMRVEVVLDDWLHHPENIQELAYIMYSSAKASMNSRVYQIVVTDLELIGKKKTRRKESDKSSLGVDTLCSPIKLCFEVEFDDEPEELDEIVHSMKYKLDMYELVRDSVQNMTITFDLDLEELE